MFVHVLFALMALVGPSHHLPGVGVQAPAHHVPGHVSVGHVLAPAHPRHP